MSKEALEIAQENLQMKVSFDFVIYHSPCNDGHAAAAVIIKHTPTITPIGLRPGESLLTDERKGIFDGKNVVMVDICVLPAEMDRLASVTSSVLVLDHHVTNQKLYQDKEWNNVTLRFEMDIPGCWLAWNYFYGSQMQLPIALYYIGLRDIWKHESVPEAVNFTTAFQCPKTWDEWNPYIFNDITVIQALIIKGSVLHEYQTSLIKTMAEKAEYITWRGFTVVIINAPHPFISDIGDYLRQDENNFVVVWNKTFSGPYTYSLRSKGDVSVAIIAQEFQGGGHKNAAGFRSDKSPSEIFK